MPRQAILITGSNGFIGSHLCAAFRGRYTVIGISTGSVNYPGQADVYHQMALPCTDIEDVFRQHRPAYCIHCAGPASVGLSMEHPSVDFQSGPVTLFQIADAIRKVSLNCTIIYPSSAAVYGNPTAVPVPESAPLRPISPYGHHKMLGELILREFAELFGIHYVILRIFSCYGAGLRKQLLWDVAQKIEHGRLELFGTGEEARDYIHVRDLAELVRLIVDRDVRDAILNAGTGTQTSVRRVAEIMLEALGKQNMQPIFTGSAKPGDPLRWEADVVRTRDLGFSPRMPFSQGIAEYAHWYREIAREHA